MGDLTVARLDDERFWLTGSYYLQDWHQRWFHQQLPGGGVDVREHHGGLGWGSRSRGRASREILGGSPTRRVERGVRVPQGARDGCRDSARAVVGRISLTGELGYEIVVPTSRTARSGRNCRTRARARPAARSATARSTACAWRRATASGRQSSGRTYTPGMSGLDRFVAFDKGDFVGRGAARRERQTGATEAASCCWRSTPDDADAAQDDGIWLGERSGRARHVGRLRSPRRKEPRPRVRRLGCARGG